MLPRECGLIASLVPGLMEEEDSVRKYAVPLRPRRHPQPKLGEVTPSRSLLISNRGFLCEVATNATWALIEWALMV